MVEINFTNLAIFCNKNYISTEKKFNACAVESLNTPIKQNYFSEKHNKCLYSMECYDSIHYVKWNTRNILLSLLLCLKHLSTCTIFTKFSIKTEQNKKCFLDAILQ